MGGITLARFAQVSLLIAGVMTISVNARAAETCRSLDIAFNTNKKISSEFRSRLIDTIALPLYVGANIRKGEDCLLTASLDFDYANNQEKKTRGNGNYLLYYNLLFKLQLNDKSGKALWSYSKIQSDRISSLVLALIERSAYNDMFSKVMFVGATLPSETAKIKRNYCTLAADPDLSYASKSRAIHTLEINTLDDGVPCLDCDSYLYKTGVSGVIYNPRGMFWESLLLSKEPNVAKQEMIYWLQGSINTTSPAPIDEKIYIHSENLPHGVINYFWKSAGGARPDAKLTLIETLSFFGGVRATIEKMNLEVEPHASLAPTTTNVFVASGEWDAAPCPKSMAGVASKYKSLMATINNVKRGEK